MAIILASDLASYLRDDSLAPQLEQIVALTNQLVEEEWSNPVDPVPARITLLTLSVAARAWVHDPSKAHLESLQRSIDDGSRTEKYRSAGNQGSVYLTPDEAALLHGSARVRSIRLIKPGDVA